MPWLISLLVLFLAGCISGKKAVVLDPTTDQGVEPRLVTGSLMIGSLARLELRDGSELTGIVSNLDSDSLRVLHNEKRGAIYRKISKVTLVSVAWTDVVSLEVKESQVFDGVSGLTVGVLGVGVVVAMAIAAALAQGLGSLR